MKLPASFAILATAACIGSAPVSAQHPGDARTAPANINMEFQNDRVTVLRIRMQPHERMPMHDVTPRVVVWLTPAHIKDVSQEGRTSELRRQPGAAEWVALQRHSGENLGDAPAEFLAIIPK